MFVVVRLGHVSFCEVATCSAAGGAADRESDDVEEGLEDGFEKAEYAPLPCCCEGNDLLDHFGCAAPHDLVSRVLYVLCCEVFAMIAKKSKG